MTRGILAFAVVVTALVIATILSRLFAEYQRGSLTTRTLVVGGIILAGLGGLLAAGVQVLLQGPGL